MKANNRIYIFRAKRKKKLVLIFDRFYSFFLLSYFIIKMPNTTSDKKVLTLAEVKQLAEDKNTCVLVINNRVYDVTKFIDEVC